MTSYISADQRRLVVKRAGGRCEYCLLHQNDVALFDHDNLAFACFECNRYKGSDIASIDPDTGMITPLYNSRQQDWTGHFALEGATIIPLTAEGRATINLLRLNIEPRMRRREGLILLGKYPG